MIVYVDTSKSGLILSEESRIYVKTAWNLIPMFKSASEFPEELDPSAWLRIEDQANQGSCQGNSLASVLEGAYYKKTGGVIQFSRQAAYIWSQQKNGIRGDSGSTVSGGLKTAMEDGLCLESSWTYTGRYVTEPDVKSMAECRAEAKNYRVKGFSPINGYDDAFAFLGSGLGYIHSGFKWTDSIDRQAATGVVERWSTSGPVGGHSVCFCGYSKEKKNSRGPYLKLFNSWSKRWGKDGIVLVSPEWFDAMCNDNWSEVAGVHEMELGPDAILPDHWN